MADALLGRIRTFLRDRPPPKLPTGTMLSVQELRQLGRTPRACFPTVNNDDLARAEAELGFPIPALLKSIYLEISNGICGFSYQIMGLAGGCACHLGTL